MPKNVFPSQRTSSGDTLYRFDFYFGKHVNIGQALYVIDVATAIAMAWLKCSHVYCASHYAGNRCRVIDLVAYGEAIVCPQKVDAAGTKL